MRRRGSRVSKLVLFSAAVVVVGISGCLICTALCLAKQPKYPIGFTPDSGETWSDNGVLRRDNGDLTGARQDFTQAIRLDPSYAMAYMHRAGTYDEARKFRQSSADYQSYIRLKPDEPYGYDGLACALYHLGATDDACTNESKAIELDPQSSLYIYRRGVMYAKLGLWQNALNDFGRAIEIDPKCPECFLNRAYCLRQLGRGAEAKTDREQAFKLKPKLRKLTGFSEI